VIKLHGSQRFIVRTPDADVEVRGTAFRVTRVLEPTCRERTRVRVDEGRVAVRSPSGEVILDPGGEWLSPCEVSDQPTPAPTAAATQGPTATAVARVASPPGMASASSKPESPSAPSGGSAASDLVAQNALFSEAMSAKARGEPGRAVASLDALVHRYPRSPLREAAEAQRMNLVVGTDRARAASLARDYLARYPRGFARAEAEEIVREGP